MKVALIQTNYLDVYCLTDYIFKYLHRNWRKDKLVAHKFTSQIYN